MLKATPWDTVSVQRPWKKVKAPRTKAMPKRTVEKVTMGISLVLIPLSMIHRIIWGMSSERQAVAKKRI
jgi:hypothetical protein